MARYILLFFTLFMIVSCASETETVTEQDAKDFLAEVQETAEIEGPVISSAYWISSNFITYDSQIVAADFSKRYTLMGLEQAREAAKFDELDLPPEDRRALNIIKNGFVMPPPLDEDLAGELSSISTDLEAMYGSGTHCFNAD